MAIAYEPETIVFNAFYEDKTGKFREKLSTSDLFYFEGIFLRRAREATEERIIPLGCDERGFDRFFFAHYDTFRCYGDYIYYREESGETLGARNWIHPPVIQKALQNSRKEFQDYLDNK